MCVCLKAVIQRDQKGKRPAGCPHVCSLSASLSPVLDTYHPGIQSPSARDKFAALWALAAVDGAVLYLQLFPFLQYVLMNLLGQRETRRSKVASALFSPPLVGGSSPSCQGARKAALEKLPCMVAMEVSGHGSSVPGKAASHTE